MKILLVEVVCGSRGVTSTKLSVSFYIFMGLDELDSLQIRKDY